MADTILNLELDLEIKEGKGLVCLTHQTNANW